MISPMALRLPLLLNSFNVNVDFFVSIKIKIFIIQKKRFELKQIYA